MTVLLRQRRLLRPSRQMRTRSRGTQGRNRTTNFLMTSGTITRCGMSNVRRRRGRKDKRRRHPTSTMTQRRSRRYMKRRGDRRQPIPLFGARHEMGFVRNSRNSNHSSRVRRRHVRNRRSTYRGSRTRRNYSSSYFRDFVFSFISSRDHSPTPTKSTTSTPRRVPNTLQKPHALHNVLHVNYYSRDPPGQQRHQLGSVVTTSESSQIGSNREASVSADSR